MFQTDPSGTYSEWKANAIGRNDKTVREYLEKHYDDEKTTDEASCVKLTVQALLEVVESGSKNIEVAVMRAGKPLTILSTEALTALVKEITDEKEAAEAKKKKGKKEF